MKYNYGYQGSEKDDEIKGNGNSYTTEFRMLDPRLGRWLSVDPVFQPWQSPYCSMDNNPISLNDEKGDKSSSTDVRKNADGSHTVVNAKNDNDNGIYEVDENGTRIGGPIAYTMRPYDFMSANNKNGEFYFNKDETGVSFNLNKLTVSGTISPRKGMENSIYDADGSELLKWAEDIFKQEVEGRGIVDPYNALKVLKSLSANGEALDLKVSLKADPYTALKFGTMNGKPRITTLRGIGNMAFGSNFESVYTQATCGVSKRQYYDLVMNQVGKYNQSQNDGNGYNSGYPYFGEHDYSGSYIYYGFWGFFKTGN